MAASHLRRYTSAIDYPYSMYTSDVIVLIIAAVFVLFVPAMNILPSILANFVNSDPETINSKLASHIDSDYVGRRVVVVDSSPDNYSVELQGSRWMAKVESTEFLPKTGDTVVVTKRDGLTLFISPDV